MEGLTHTQGTQQGATQLGLQAGLVARLVHKIHYGQTKQAAQLHMPLHFVGRLHRHRAALHHGVVGDHAHGHAIQTRQGRDDRAALVATDFEHRVDVHDR